MTGHPDTPDRDRPPSPDARSDADLHDLPVAGPPASPHTLWDDQDDELDDTPMPLLDHLGELRRRIFRCLIAVVLGFCVCYSGSDLLYAEVLRPLKDSLPSTAKIVFGNLPGPFFLHLKLAALASVFLVSPYLFYQVWAFITPGLYAHERKYIVPLGMISAVFFISGAAFCYIVVFPFAFTFFLQYSTDVVSAMLEVEIYFSFVLKLIFAFGLIFEMPLFAFFLARMGLVTAGLMRRVRKYALLGILVVAAILTPPDVFSQLLMAGPMFILYELSIVVAAIFGRKPKPEPHPDADDTPPDTTGDAA